MMEKYPCLDGPLNKLTPENDEKKLKVGEYGKGQ